MFDSIFFRYCRRQSEIQKFDSSALKLITWNFMNIDLYASCLHSKTTFFVDVCIQICVEAFCSGIYMKNKRKLLTTLIYLMTGRFKIQLETISWKCCCFFLASIYIFRSAQCSFDFARYNTISFFFVWSFWRFFNVKI